MPLKIIKILQWRRHYCIQCNYIQDKILFELIKVSHMFCVCGGGVSVPYSGEGFQNDNRVWGILKCLEEYSPLQCHENLYILHTFYLMVDFMPSVSLFGRHNHQIGSNFSLLQLIAIQIKKNGPLKYPKSTLIGLRKCKKMTCNLFVFLDNLKIT